MNDQARRLLAFVIHHYGVDVIQTPKQLQALLKDHAKGQFKPEISLFMLAITEGLVVKLLTNQYLSVQLLSARAIKHLQEDCFIEKQAAHWVIDSWCIALKLTRPIPIHTPPAPVAQAKPSPVAVIKSPVPPPKPTVQATPVPVIQGASSRKPLFFLLFLVIVVFLAIWNKPDKTPAGVGTQEDSARKPRTTLNWHDGASFTIEGDPNEQMHRSAGLATQEDSDGKPRTAIGAEQTQDAILINKALGASLGVSLGTDPFGIPLVILETDAGIPFMIPQITQFGVTPSGDESAYAGSPWVPQETKDLMRKLRDHRPAPDLYTADGKPTEKLLDGVYRVKMLDQATDRYRKGATSRAGVSPEEDYRAETAMYLNSDPHAYMDGWAYLNGKHGLKNVVKDNTKTEEQPRKDAEQGDAIAQYILGSVAWYRKAAEQGYAVAQTTLGFMYRDGQGVTKDEAQAVTWFRKAAEQGNENAQRELEKIKNRVAQKTQKMQTTESPVQEPSKTQIASQPATQTQGTWITDWGNDIIGLVTTETCHVAELTNQGYVYAISSSIPLARLKNNADAWQITGDRATTVLGCWFKKDANNTGLIHAKFKRKKDDKIWEDDLNLADGSWTFKRID